MLSDPAPAERLNAARYLQFWALPSDIPALRSAIAQESVGWVRRALEAALQRLGDRSVLTVDLEDLSQPLDESTADLAAIARSRVASIVVHELEPIVGAIEYYSDIEFPNFQGSKSQLHVDRLAGILRAIETLGKISNTPRLEDVDLYQLVVTITESQRLAFDTNIRIEGPTGVTLLTDPGLIRIIVGNGLKNACESTIQVTDRPTSISVFYGVSDRDCWITVADTGIGLPLGSSKELFEMGRSTKENHLGVGLTLSHEAARTLSGELKLTTDSISTRLEFSFPLTRSA